MTTLTISDGWLLAICVLLALYAFASVFYILSILQIKLDRLRAKLEELRAKLEELRTKMR